MAASYSESPPHNPGFRIGSLRGFLPLAEDSLSTRGQRLPALIQSRSTANLEELRAQLRERRHSTITSHGEDEGQADGEQEHSDEREGQSVGGHAGPGAKRLMAAVETLKTPQMRSMRLIGNSNPRYQW